MKPRLGPRPAAPRAGIAMLMVLLVLIALLVLCAPFLLTTRNADSSSTRLAEVASAELALDTATRHGRRRLGTSHPSVDPTPDWDTAEELSVDNRFPEGFLDANDPRGVMWDLETHDLSGRIDLNSASPQVLSNMMEVATFLTDELRADGENIQVSALGGFPEQGYAVIDGEIIGYLERGGRSLSQLERGVLAEEDAEGNFSPCGPRPPMNHNPGAVVTDQRAWAIAQWRMLGATGFREFDSPEGLRGAGVLARQGQIGEGSVSALGRLGTAYGGVAGGARWQLPARVVNEVEAEVSCTLLVEGPGYFNPGTTVLIEGPGWSELALVSRVTNAGQLRLVDPVMFDYPAYETSVRPLARRPVNINSAPPEVLYALFLNLKLRDQNSRVTETEARALAEVVIQARPFGRSAGRREDSGRSGLEDLLVRVLLPAAGLAPPPRDAGPGPAAMQQAFELAFEEKFGEPFRPERHGDDFPVPYLPEAALIDADDARAIYLNALNANDVELDFSTMPFCFTSRDTYRFDLRATVNAPSGVARLSRAREQVELVVPQGDVLRLWTRQQDFDEALRLDRQAPWWVSGPVPTSRVDTYAGTVPPSRFAPHWGAHNWETEQIDHHFASLDREQGFIQPWVSEVDEVDWRAGRVLHFRDEPEELEGRDLSVEPVRISASSDTVNWVAGGLMRAFGLELWVRPEALVHGDLLFDVGGDSTESDRVSLVVDNQDLVLRVLDAVGDHPDTAFIEVGEVRLPLASGDDPGLPDDTWSHLAIDVLGNRPSQMTLFQDGAPHGRTPGLTELRANLGQDDSTILVESTEGFPDTCVIRVGQELMEVQVNGGASFSAEHQPLGALAGFGGRLARERFDLYPTPINQGLLSKTVSHPAGTPVELYGYSTPLISNAPQGISSLPSELGSWGLARVVEVEGPSSGMGEPITIQAPSTPTNPVPVAITIGHGVEGEGVSEVTGLRLVAADPDRASIMEAFSTSGGYALVMQRLPTGIQVGVTEQPQGPEGAQTVDGTYLFGMEVVRYSGWSGDVLEIARWSSSTAGMQAIAGGGAGYLGPSRAFVVEFASVVNDYQEMNEDLGWQVLVMPISVPAPGAVGGFDFPVPEGGISEFAQLTHVTDAENTEWVRYDEIFNGHLLRNSADALTAAYARAVGLGARIDVAPPLPPQTPALGPPGWAPAAAAAPGAHTGGSSPPAASSAAASPPAVGPPPAGSQWEHDLGDAEDENWPLTRAVGSVFQFRGVFGTYSHDHAAGTPILPVFRVTQRGIHGGQPGRYDPAFLVDASPADPGWPVRVHHTHRPFNRLDVSWVSGQGPFGADQGQVAEADFVGVVTQAIYVALQEQLAVPIAAGSVPPDDPTLDSVGDTRLMARLVMFPSGERPRGVSEVALGGSFNAGGGSGGGQVGGVPLALVDEVVFGDTSFGQGTTFGLAGQGGMMILEQDLPVGGSLIQIAPQTLLLPLGPMSLAPGDVLDMLPDDAGLVRIGSEIIGYTDLDAGFGVLSLAAAGRGMLGTTEQNHAAGQSVTWLAYQDVAELVGGVTAESANLAVSDMAGFGFRGAARIGDELIHWTRQRNAGFEMPAYSTVPGERDGLGAGLFRGRFGTTPQGHPVGTLVIRQPFRYWDRWAPGADALELAYFELRIDQPDAYWRHNYWLDRDAGHLGPRLGVLQRSLPEVPWDADPDETAGLDLFWEGSPDEGENSIMRQSDAIQWRIFVEYGPDSFDPFAGLAHGWKSTPRLDLFGAVYAAPGRVLRRLDR